MNFSTLNTSSSKGHEECSGHRRKMYMHPSCFSKLFDIKKKQRQRTRTNVRFTLPIEEMTKWGYDMIVLKIQDRQCTVHVVFAAQLKTGNINFIQEKDI